MARVAAQRRRRRALLKEPRQLQTSIKSSRLDSTFSSFPPSVFLFSISPTTLAMASIRAFATRNAESLLQRPSTFCCIRPHRVIFSLRTFAAATMSNSRLLDEIKVEIT